uniref:nuclear transport factor 2 family protein n=1 Tax=Leptolyngbya sp. NIES-2104 TaxID=1552121 RepID=UPI000AC3D7DD|nr:nuclear transport factor 2 family protein [Leptolyngbya sp. NIES-2104]
METRQITVLERLQQAQNAQDLKALLACFAPNFQGNHPLHPERGFEGMRMSVRIGLASPTPSQTFTQSCSVRQLRGTWLGLSGSGSAPIGMGRSLGCAA